MFDTGVSEQNVFQNVSHGVASTSNANLHRLKLIIPETHVKTKASSINISNGNMIGDSAEQLMHTESLNAYNMPSDNEEKEVIADETASAYTIYI